MLLPRDIVTYFQLWKAVSLSYLSVISVVRSRYHGNNRCVAVPRIDNVLYGLTSHVHYLKDGGWSQNSTPSLPPPYRAPLS